MNQLVLLPQPRSLTPAAGTYTLQSGRRIVLLADDPTAARFGALRLQTALRAAGAEWELGATLAGPDDAGVVLRIDAAATDDAQGYRLAITPERIEATAATPAGLFYAICTLIQIVEQAAPELPCLTIEDRPDFPARGVMLDISRDKVPTMATLRELIDQLAGWKINQLQLYTEHTFAYRAHPDVWAAASPITGAEILELDAFCRERFVELVPNQNSFGHMHRWLIHPRYAALGEVQDGFDTPWGHESGPFSLAPVDPGSLELVSSLFDELLPHFGSRMVNVGCDETFDLGQGRSKAEVERQGVGRVYLDFLKQIHADITARGRTMQFWGDIIVQHPELIAELPKDAIALEWGYEADWPFAEDCARFAAAGLRFYVCPGTSAWCSLGGRTANALGNLQNAARNGLKHGAIGYLNTDWGDRGHWQTLPVSYLGFAVGAAVSWAGEAAEDLDVAAVLSRHAFKDDTGVVGRVAYELGDVYRALPAPGNGSLLFWTLQLPLAQLSASDKAAQLSGTTALFRSATAEQFRAAEATVGELLDQLEEHRMQRPDAALVEAEFRSTGRLMQHACRRAQLALDPEQPGAAALRQELDADMQAIIAEYRRIWLERNRPGGLDDSVGRLERARADYAAS